MKIADFIVSAKATAKHSEKQNAAQQALNHLQIQFPPSGANSHAALARGIASENISYKGVLTSLRKASVRKIAKDQKRTLKRPLIHPPISTTR